MIWGSKGIFLDSSFNMSSDKFHFRQWPENDSWRGTTMDNKADLGKQRPKEEPKKIIETQYYAHLQWVVEMQQMGYEYCGEDTGVFGINRTGPGTITRLESLPIWQESYCDFDVYDLSKAGYDLIDVFFKGLAYRMIWKIYFDIKENRLFFSYYNKKEQEDAILGDKRITAYKLLKVFNQVEPFLYNRNILPQEQGVEYTKEGKSVLWAFEDFEHKLEGEKKVTELVTGASGNQQVIMARKNSVYLIEDLG
ncbi:MAG: hypothetical protein HC896_00630 [Bacteroidales bacterium]|nr:hypothetical protein [Bacteroidales bacterium]